MVTSISNLITPDAFGRMVSAIDWNEVHVFQMRADMLLLHTQGLIEVFYIDSFGEGRLLARFDPNRNEFVESHPIDPFLADLFELNVKHFL